MSPRHRSPAEQLVARVLGHPVVAGIVVDLTPADGGVSRFSVAATGGVVRIEASDGVAAASGLRHYLRTACDLDPLDLHPEPIPAGALPDQWPDLHRVEQTSPWLWRYHLNYCTFGYSAAFWDWPRWEREIDLMAMTGVNLPLATVGFEGVWLRVLEDLGLTRERALAHLGSQAFHPWVWMGCVHDHGAPMTAAEVEDRVRLGQRIIERQRELGMTPVLPGFTGYLPHELAGDDGRPVDWMGFDNRAVDPRSPLFQQVGAALLDVQHDLFGAGAFHAIDPFVEGTPPVESPADVAAYAEAIAGLLDRHAPGSTWVLQGWPFGYRADYWSPDRIAAFLGAMPAGRTLVLDLWAEHSSVRERAGGFAGRAWCWSVLHSLGGRPGLHGAVDVIAAEPARLRSTPDGNGLVGVGSTMESLGHDPLVWALLADVRWVGQIDDLEAWVEAWVDRRYGRSSPALHASWRTIVGLCYRDGAASGPPTSVVMSRPSLAGDLRPRLPLNLTTPDRSTQGAAELLEAWEPLVDSLAERASPALHRDVVEIGLDVLARHASRALESSIAAVRAGDTGGLAAERDRFLGLVQAMDDLSASHPDFRLDTWVAQARSAGATPARRLELELDAKRLLTVWVESGHQLSDYAGRHWAGLLAGYYLPRWECWFDALEGELAGAPRDADAFDRSLAEIELAWLAAPLDGGPAVEEGAASAVAARRLLRASR